MSVDEFGNLDAPMNSDHAPTAEEPLPPLKIVCRNGAGDSSYMCLQAGKELLAEIFPTRSKRLQQLLDAKDARIAELEEDVRLAKHERNQYDSAHKREVVNVLKLSAKLRAVSDALQEILKTATQFAYNPQLDNAVARIRAIVEGK